MDCLTAAEAIGARVRGPNVGFVGVSTDSRAVRPGELFVALKGERFDGNLFAAEAFARGAAAVLVSEDRVFEHPGTLLIVGDTLRALGTLAGFWRQRFELPLVGISGSNGKTTVKEMCAAMLREHFDAAKVLATRGNLNNDIGLPLTLFGLRAEHEAAVIEIGMNHPGETAYLAGLAMPGIGVINNAQREHQEFMQSVADVAAEHAALINSLPVRGVAVINADDDFAPFWRTVVERRNAEGYSISVVDFGLQAPAAVSARLRSEGWGSELMLQTPQGDINAELRVPGRHNVLNALAAAAAALGAGASLGAVARAVDAFQPVAGRLQAKQGLHGSAVIDDTYNANPDSVRAAIAVLARAARPRWLVLGDMGEVGERGLLFHREIGEYARAAGLDRLLTVGVLAVHAVEAFGAGGTHYDSSAALIDALRGGLEPGCTVLVKGSRFMRMERIVHALTGEAMEAH